MGAIGPKISSLKTAILVVTSTSIVGLNQKPLSKDFGTLPPESNVAPFATASFTKISHS